MGSVVAEKKRRSVALFSSAKTKTTHFGWAVFREAGNGTRTRDTLLGKQVLYQLSYTRN